MGEMVNSLGRTTIIKIHDFYPVPHQILLLGVRCCVVVSWDVSQTAECTGKKGNTAQSADSGPRGRARQWPSLMPL